MGTLGPLAHWHPLRNNRGKTENRNCGNSCTNWKRWKKLASLKATQKLPSCKSTNLDEQKLVFVKFVSFFCRFYHGKASMIQWFIWGICFYVFQPHLSKYLKLHAWWSNVSGKKTTLMENEGLHDCHHDPWRTLLQEALFLREKGIQEVGWTKIEDWPQAGKNSS